MEINSTLIKHIWMGPTIKAAFSEEIDILIEFHKSTTMYVYSMPTNMLKDMLNSDSIGQYFLKNIKDNPDISFEKFKPITLNALEGEDDR